MSLDMLLLIFPHYTQIVYKARWSAQSFLAPNALAQNKLVFNQP